MEKRVIKFDAFIPALGLMLEGVDVYANGTIGISFDDLANTVEEEGFSINEDWVEDKEGNRVLNLLCGEEYFWLESNQYKLRQYTGLSDKIGCEIFEGDIIQVDDMESTVGVVVYYDGRFSLKQKSFAYSSLTAYNPNIMTEVIGNIYEHPDLLSPTK